MTKLRELTPDQYRRLTDSVMEAVKVAFIAGVDGIAFGGVTPMVLVAEGSPCIEYYIGLMPVNEAAPMMEEFAGSVMRLSAGAAPWFKDFQDQDESTLRATINVLCGSIRAALPPDVLGFMLVMMQDNGIAQYGGSITRESAVGALRELADRLEQNATVERDS